MKDHFSQKMQKEIETNNFLSINIGQTVSGMTRRFWPVDALHLVSCLKCALAFFHLLFTYLHKIERSNLTYTQSSYYHNTLAGPTVTRLTQKTLAVNTLTADFNSCLNVHCVVVQDWWRTVFQIKEPDPFKWRTDLGTLEVLSCHFRYIYFLFFLKSMKNCDKKIFWPVNALSSRLSLVEIHNMHQSATFLVIFEYLKIYKNIISNKNCKLASSCLWIKWFCYQWNLAFKDHQRT